MSIYCVIAIITIIVGFVFYFFYYYERKLKAETTKISFKEALDLVDLPLITFENNNHKFNFILDTGSNFSYIRASCFKLLDGEVHSSDISVVGCGGQSSAELECDTLLKYKDRTYRVLLRSNSSLDISFDTLSKTDKITLHGILGNDFLQDHRYVLDFAELVAYNK